MKKILCILFLTVGLQGCSKPESENKTIPTEVVHQNIEAQTPTPIAPVVTPVDSTMTELEAMEFAKGLYRKIEDDDKIIRTAFQAGQYQVLSQYEKHFTEFAYETHKRDTQDKAFGQSYFPQDPVAEPYAICDKAINELSGLAVAMLNSTKTDIPYEDAAYYAKNLRLKDQMYKESKELCRQRVNLNYEQAVEAYESSDSI